MPSTALTEIETRLPALSMEEQLLLIERLAKNLRTSRGVTLTDEELDALAADPDIQREIKAIEAEFAATDMDGLENL